VSSRPRARESHYDVCIVGAGTAGCVLAAQLDPGLRVLLIETRSLPRNKPCSGILVREGIRALLPLAPPERIFLEPREIDITYGDWSRATYHRSSKKFWNLDRQALDAWLLERLASRENVEVCDATRLTAISRGSGVGVWTLELSHGARTRIVIVRQLVGCDGANSSVRRAIRGGGAQHYVAIQELVPCAERGPELSVAHFIFDKRLTNWFGWLIPKGDFIDIGIAANPRGGRSAFERFKKEAESRFGVTGTGVMRSGLLSRLGAVDQICLGAENVFLAGEAAGLVSPSSGEGISYALRSGALLATALNTGGADVLALYREACRPLVERLSLKLEKSQTIRTSGDPIAHYGTARSNSTPTR